MAEMNQSPQSSFKPGSQQPDVWPDQQPDQTADQFDQSGLQPGVDDLLPGPEPEYLLLEWVADSRYVRPRTRQYYSSILVLGILFSILFFAANQIALIVLLWALVFLSYVLARVKPEPIGIQITTYGIRYQEQLIFWDEMSRFWVKEIHGFYQVHVEVPSKIFRQLVLLPSNTFSATQVTVDDIIDLLGRVVPYEEPIPNRFDLWVQWLERKFPLESEQAELANTPQPAPQNVPLKGPQPLPQQPEQGAQPSFAPESQAQPQLQPQASTAPYSEPDSPTQPSR